MRKLIYRFIIFASLLTLLCGASFAQNNLNPQINPPTEFNGIQYDEFGNPLLPEEDTGEQPDSTKPRDRKPLESYFFDNDVRKQPNFAWNVSTYMNRVTPFAIDTVLTDYNLDYIFLRKDVGDAYLGNLGGGTIPLNYFRRPEFQDFSFARPYYAYIYTPETAPFYNVKKPFTMLSYSTAGQRQYAEEMISVIHAQNISPSTGFNVTYRTNKTKGRYLNQATNDVNLSFGISHTGKRYSAHAGYIYNGIDNFENGGVADDWHITDGEQEDPFNVPIRLGDSNRYLVGANEGKARSIIKGNTFYTVHSYGIPLRRVADDEFSIAEIPSVFVGYAFEWSQFYRKYYDNRDIAHVNLAANEEEATVNHLPTKPYYDNWYFNPELTQDSLSERKMSNRFFVQLQPWDREGIVGVVDAGVGMDNFQYYTMRPGDYISGNTSPDKKSNFYFYGAVEGKFRKYFDWGANARIVPAGYRAGDTEVGTNVRLNVFLKERPVSLSGDIKFKHADPSYWTQNFYSNHFIWQDLALLKENETRIDVRLSIPHINAEASLHQSITTNKTYFGADMLPVQQPNAVSVTGVYLRKNFRLGDEVAMNFDHRVMLQWSSDQVAAPVPMFSAYVSYYFEFNVVKNVMRASIGLDGWYNTPYYAFGYNPAIGQFYNQREMEYGGYPMIDFFAMVKWKRARIRLMVTHLDEGFIGSNNYFTVMHYPLNPRMLKIGISWGFYD